ncbi:MAG: hypothetical protein N3G20_11275 [Verrucomicrobiae bacterium]|nr:hypothetical protein [Verrucomicrobiae bacterium]
MMTKQHVIRTHLLYTDNDGAVRTPPVAETRAVTPGATNARKTSVPG